MGALGELGEEESRCLAWGEAWGWRGEWLDPLMRQLKQFLWEKADLPGWKGELLRLFFSFPPLWLLPKTL